MKSRTFRTALSAVLVTFLFAATAMPMAAQDNSSQKHKHHKYKLIDIGTFGGPTSYAALALHRGGVGYYGSSEFVHVDVGRVRRW